MMSDHAAQRYKQGEGLGLVFSGTSVDASQHPYTEQWMAHWMQACRSSCPEGSQLHNAAVVGDVVGHFKGCDSLAVERVKSKEFKLLSMDMNQRYDCGCKGKTSSAAGNVDLIPYAIQSGETTDGARMRRNVEFFYDETTISRQVTAHQLTKSSIKWKESVSYNFQDLDVFALEFEHFPMFDINRKLETIMASTKKSSYGAKFVKMMNEKLPLCESPVTSSPVELAPGSRLGAKNKIGGTEKVERYEGLQSDEADDMDGISFHAIHGCKCQNTNRAACISSRGLAYKGPTNADLTCMQHKSCCSSSSYKSIESGAKKNPELISRRLGYSWTSLKDGSTHVLRESTQNDLSRHFSTEEHNTEVKVDSSYRLLLGQKRLNEPVSIYHSPTKMPKCSMHDVNHQPGSWRLKSVESGEGFHKLSSTMKYLLVAEKMHQEQCHRELKMGDSTFQVEGTAFSETIALPTEQNYGKKEEESFENFTCDLERKGGGGIGAHLIEPHNESSVKTDTNYPNTFHRSSSLLGETFPRLQKSATYPNLRKSETALASPAQQAISRNIEARMTDVKVEHPASTDRATCASNKEGGTSKTESMAEDHDVLHAKITDVSSSSSLPNYTMLTEACSRWVKRLQQNNSGTHAKRFKNGDASSIEVMQKFSKIKNYNSLSYDVHWCLKEQHKFEKAMKLSKFIKPCSSDSEEGAVQSWIRRWCHNHHQESRPGAFQPKKLRKLPEKFEDETFASIGAMALMGKSMNNYRPCSFRRKKASLEWNV